jgi:hypothetical protein
MTISRKFFAVLVVLAPLIVAVAVAIAGEAGLASMKSEFDRVFTDNIHASQVSTTLGAELSRADQIALQLAASANRRERQSLNASLDQSVIPAVDAGLRGLKALHAHDARAERAPVQALYAGWSRFIALRETGVLAGQDIRGALGRADALTTEIAGIFAPLRTITQRQADLEAFMPARLTHAPPGPMTRAGWSSGGSRSPRLCSASAAWCC